MIDCSKWREYYLYVNKNRLRDIALWAEQRNIIKGGTPRAQMVKLMEETGELAGGIAKGKVNVIEDSIGDCVVVLTIIAEQHGLTIETCIEKAYNEIRDRKGKMINGVFVKEGDLNE